MNPTTLIDKSNSKISNTNAILKNDLKALPKDQNFAEIYNSLQNLIPSIRLKNIRNSLIDAKYEICIEKARYMTEYFKKISKVGFFQKLIEKIHYIVYKKSVVKISKDIYQKKWQIKLNRKLISYYRRKENNSKGQIQIDFANAFKYTLEKVPIKIFSDELIVGNLSSKRIGAPLHPDLGALMLLPEIEEISSRSRNPISINKEELESLKNDIFPFWFSRSILANMNLYMKNPETFNMLMNGSLFVLTQFSGISHLTPNYPEVLHLGIRGIMEKAENKRKFILDQKDAKSEEIQESLNFLESIKISCEAVILYANRWQKYLIETAQSETNEVRKIELEKMAEIVKRVPEHPAKTFQEALQSIMLTHAAVHYESFQHGVSFGRLDQYLYPYFKKDLDSGELTIEKAVELLGCFFAKAAELLPLFFDKATDYFSGLSSASGTTIGGVEEDGKTSVNELSFLVLKAYDQLRLRQPNFHARIHESTPTLFRTYCMEIIKKGGGMPALFNDEKIIESQIQHHVAKKDATNYSIVGCSEWGSPYNSFPAAGAIFINIASTIPLLFKSLRNVNGLNFSSLPQPITTIHDFKDLQVAVWDMLKELISIALDGNDAIETSHANHRPTPFLSAIVDGCINNAKEVNDGGAIYNPTGCQATGLADLADSLYAIEQLVFLEKKLTLEELNGIVANNFSGNETLRKYILNRIPKYGENDLKVDEIASWVAEIFCNEVKKKKNSRGGYYSPGFWTMTTHQGFGKRQGALPSGRMSGDSLANGVSPKNGWDKKGPTATMNSIASLDGNLISNGYVLNQKLSPNFVKGDFGNQIMLGLIDGFFSKGGMQVQFNIIDPEVLIDAKKNPDQYKDLVVRISGYSAYFNDLTESMKDEIIERTMHCSCG